MVRRRQRTARRVAARRPPKSRRRRRARKSSSNIIARGVRALIPLLPGSSALSTVADLAFKAFGLAKITYENSMAVGDTMVYGMSCITTISLANIVARSPVVTRTYTAGKVSFTSPLVDGRLTSLSISCKPDNKISNRRGRWGMCYIPFRSSEDVIKIKELKSMTLAEITSMPNSVSTGADRPLQLTFVPTPRDTYAYGFLPLDTACGAICITYTDEVRESYTAFTTDDFAPNVTLTGTVVCSQPISGSGGKKFNDTTIQVLQHDLYIMGEGIAHMTPVPAHYVKKVEGRYCFRMPISHLQRAEIMQE